MISVIIPAYNVEKYIDSCLQSVVMQENAEFEAIVVNDGSTDQTGVKCRKWSENYKNLIYIEQENQGQGSARNRAVAEARGEWLVFLDADDELIPGALHRLEETESEEADIVCYEFYLMRRQIKEREHICLFQGECQRKEDLLRESTSFLWDKMFRTKFWRREGITLDNTYGEDFKAVYLMTALCSGFIFLREPLVLHYERETNLSSDPQRVMEITGAVETTLEEFVRRKLFGRYKASLFYAVYTQYETYRAPDFCDFQPGQPEEIRRGLGELIRIYFSECLSQLEKLQKTELILIGRKWSFWYGDEELFKQARIFLELEKVVAREDSKVESESDSILYLVDLSCEGRSRRFGTRTVKWQIDRWRDLSREFLRSINQPGKDVQVFVYDRKDMDNRELFQILMEHEGIYGICEGTPILERLVSQEVCAGSPFYKDIAKTLETGSAGEYWCRGEQYRLQFNESILNAWLALKNRNKGFASFFVERGYRDAAIYGMGYLGERLLEELRDDGVEVSYGIDRQHQVRTDMPVYGMEDKLPQTDVIIVTVVHLFLEIKYELERKTDISIISLEEILETLLQEDDSYVGIKNSGT